MFERFTDRARKVMALANQEARRFNGEWIDAEHILLGLIKEGSGVGANVLKNLDVDLKKLCLEIEELLNKKYSDEVMTDRLPHLPRAKYVIEFAIEEARLLNCSYVGTEHILLGLMHINESIVLQAFAKKGITIENVRAEVLKVLEDGSKNKGGNTE